MILPFGLSTLKETKRKEDQAKAVQTAIDMTYLKEQGDKTVELLEEMKAGPVSMTLSNLEKLDAGLHDTRDKLEGLERNLLNTLSVILQEQQQSISQNKEYQTGLTKEVGQLSKKVRQNQGLMRFLIVFNLLSLSGIIFMILYTLEIISF